jgi:predicted transcriptional regulator of viral defense system
MADIVKYIKKNGGYATMKELKEAKFQTREIKKYVQNNVLEKIKSGLYRLSNIDFYRNVNLSFVDVCNAIPSGIICLGSAINYYSLSTYNPNEIHIAVMNSKKPVKIIYPPVKFYFFRKNQFTLGIKIHKTKFGDIRIYDIEKTICDIFRFRNEYGDEIALESLRNYTKRKEADYFKLRKYSKICRVYSIINPYLKGLIG